MIFEALADVVFVLWDPPVEWVQRTWRRFQGRSRAWKVVGVVVCTLEVLLVLALWFAVLGAICIGGYYAVRAIA